MILREGRAESRGYTVALQGDNPHLASGGGSSAVAQNRHNKSLSSRHKAI